MICAAYGVAQILQLLLYRKLTTDIYPLNRHVLPGSMINGQIVTNFRNSNDIGDVTVCDHENKSLIHHMAYDPKYSQHLTSANRKTSSEIPLNSGGDHTRIKMA